MRILILSDIHANFTALNAVMADAQDRYDEIVCLGDIVGYGPDPDEATQWVREHARFTVRGNHDRACTGSDCVADFTVAARMAVEWTCRQLATENLDYLRELPAGPLDAGGYFLTHGSPRDEDEYVISKEDANHQYRFLPGDVTFFGHTHVQVGFGLRQGRVWLLIPPRYDQSERAYELEADARYLLNPGSVGQPRDHDPRAAYAIYDPEAKTYTVRRVEYDIAATQGRIITAGLPSFLADRLMVGR